MAGPYVGNLDAKQSLRIAIISKSNAQGGGASRFAEDLAGWLGEAGHEVDHLCAFLPENRRSFQHQLYPNGSAGRLCRFVHRRARRSGFNEVFPVEYVTGLRRLPAKYDAIHFHDHYTAYSLATPALLAKRTRVFFTAHDCLHFTGDGIYPPLPGEAAPEQRSFRRKASQWLNRQAAGRYGVQYIYPSRWLRNEAQKHLRFRKEPVVLPYGFDARPYSYRPRDEARRQLGLPLDRGVICISAHYLSDKRKGVAYALNAVAAIQDLNPYVVLVGNPADGVEKILSGVPFWFSGYVASRERLGLLYAAADIYLCCSLQDNLPISVQEAMAAATPLVGFATGGVPEMVENGKSAWLVPTADQEALNAALREAFLSNATAQRGLAGRQTVSERFSREQCVQSHVSLYSGMAPRQAGSE